MCLKMLQFVLLLNDFQKVLASNWHLVRNLFVFADIVSHGEQLSNSPAQKRVMYSSFYPTS